jgi:MFS family permease
VAVPAPAAVEARRPPVAPLALAIFATHLGLGVAIPLVPLLLTPSGAGPGAVGAVFTAYAAALVAAQVVGGALAERIGAGRLAVAALGIYMLAMLGYLVSHAPAALVAVRLVEGTGSGLLTPAVMSLAARAAPPERRGRAMGLVLGLGGLGFLAGPLLGGYLAPLGLHLPFLVAGAVAAVAAATALVALPPDPPAPPDAGGWAGAARADAGAIAARLVDPRFLGAAAPLMAVKVNFAALQAGVPLLAARALGATPAETAWLFAVTALAYVAVQPVVGRLADRLGTRGPLAVAFVGMAALLAWQAGRTTFQAFLPGWVVLSLLQTGAVTLALKHLADRVVPPGAAGGKALGLASATADLGMIAAPAVFLPLAAWRVEAILLGPAATVLGFLALFLALDRPASGGGADVVAPLPAPHHGEGA